MVSEETIRSRACLRASSVMIFLETWRDRLPLMVAIPDFRRSADTSLSTTSSPASAATCAMPLPIWPEPITPTFLIITAISSCFERSLLSELGQRFRQFRNRLIQIRHQAVIGDLEDRRVLIL